MSKRSDGAVAHALWIVFGGMVLLALPVIPSIARHAFDFSAAMVASL